MSFDMDKGELREWADEGPSGVDRIWAAYQHVCEERDVLKGMVLIKVEFVVKKRSNRYHKERSIGVYESWSDAVTAAQKEPGTYAVNIYHNYKGMMGERRVIVTAEETRLEVVR